MSQQFLVAYAQGRWSCCREWSRSTRAGEGSAPGVLGSAPAAPAGGSPLPAGPLGVSDRGALQSLRSPRFQVDFQCGCSLQPRPDIAIHFNPRFHTTQPHVICNTLHQGRWQAEARWPRLALQRGASFLTLFLFGNEEMKVSEWLSGHLELGPSAPPSFC